MSQLVQCKPDNPTAVARFVRAVGRSLAYIPFTPQSHIRHVKRLAQKEVLYQEELRKQRMLSESFGRQRELHAGQLAELVNAQAKNSTNAESQVQVLPENLVEIKAKGRRALISLMQNHGIPMPAQGGPFRENSPSTEFVRLQLERSGMFKKDIFTMLGDQLLHDEQEVRSNAATLLAGIVLDEEMHGDLIRKKALATLFSASTYSEESQEMLQQFGFTNEIIEGAVSALSLHSKKEADWRKISKKSTILGYIGLLGAASAFVLNPVVSLPLIVSSLGAITGIFLEVKGMKRRFRLEDNNKHIIESALNEVDQFQKLLSQGQKAPALPVHEQDS